MQQVPPQVIRFYQQQKEIRRVACGRLRCLHSDSSLRPAATTAAAAAPEIRLISSTPSRYYLKQVVFSTGTKLPSEIKLGQHGRRQRGRSKGPADLCALPTDAATKETARSVIVSIIPTFERNNAQFCGESTCCLLLPSVFGREGGICAGGGSYSPSIADFFAKRR